MALSKDKAMLAVGGNPTISIFNTAAATREAEGSSASLTANLPPVRQLAGHVGNILALGFQNDAKWLWSASDDGTARIWDYRASDPTCQREVFNGVPLSTAALHPNQAELFMGDQNGQIKVWDLATNSIILEEQIPGSVPVQWLSISADGRYLAAIDRSGRVHLWRLRAAQQGHPLKTVAIAHLTTIQAHSGYGIKCVFSPDSSSLVTTSSDHTARLWSIADGHAAGGPNSDSETSGDEAPPATILTPQRVFEGHVRWVWDCAFSADAAYLVSCSSDNTARLWDVGTGETIAIYTGHSKAVTCLALNDPPVPIN